jgi:hypothetical protein
VRRWAGLLLLAAAVWLGAFGISLLVVEWRQPDMSAKDIARLEGDLAGLKGDVEGIKSQLGMLRAPPVTGTPVPEARAVPLKPGTEVQSGAARITVVGITTGLGPEFAPLRSRVDFIVEGPLGGALGSDFKVIDAGGFVCPSGINAESGAPLAAGEKTRFWILYGCAEGNEPKTLLLDWIRFEFP